MNFTHRPSQTQAQRLKTNTQEKTLSSLIYVLHICEDILGKKTKLKVINFIESAKSNHYSSGLLFYLIQEIIRGIEKKSISRIKNSFQHILLLNTEQEAPLPIINKNSLPPKLASLYSKMNDDTHTFELLSTKEQETTSAKPKINHAIQIISTIDKELHLEIATIVDEIFIFRTHKTHEKVVHSGSDFNKLGTIFINEETCNGDLYFLIDKIIHESAHQILLSIMTIDEVILNDDKERYPSPLRNEPRTMNGIYHAAFVLYRISLFFKKIKACNPADIRASIISDNTTQEFSACYATIDAHAQLTRAGRNIIDACNADIRESLNGLH